MLAAQRMQAAQRPFSRASAVTCRASFSTAKVLHAMSQDQLKPNQTPVKVGDTVKVGLAVVEGKGKTRTQTLEGVIIAQDGSGIDRTVTFRRVFQGIGIELTMPIHSPQVQSFLVLRNGRVRRSKLYYLRDRIGRAAKLKEVLQRREVKK